MSGFGRFIQELTSTYSLNLTQGMEKHWRQQLKYFSAEELLFALKEHINGPRGNFKPSIHDIKKNLSIKTRKDQNSERVKTTREERQRYHKWALKNGLVPVKIENQWQYAKRRACIKWRGEWRLKIDFCNDFLGNDFILSEMKNLLIRLRGSEIDENEPPITKANFWAKLIRTKNFSAEYWALLDDLTECAKQRALQKARA